MKLPRHRKSYHYGGIEKHRRREIDKELSIERLLTNRVAYRLCRIFPVSRLNLSSTVTNERRRKGACPSTERVASRFTTRRYLGSRWKQKKSIHPLAIFYPRASRFMIPDIFCTLRRKEIVDKPRRRFMRLRTMRRNVSEKDIARLVN